MKEVADRIFARGVQRRVHAFIKDQIYQACKGVKQEDLNEAKIVVGYALDVLEKALADDIRQAREALKSPDTKKAWKEYQDL